MILVDTSHTAHTRARTGIQRVTRGLLGALAAQGPTTAITWDPHERQWRELEDWEQANLASTEPEGGRGAHWPATARLRGLCRRLVGRRSAPPRPAEGESVRGLVLPELFSPEVAAQFQRLRDHGPAIAFFHDAIALRRPSLFPRKVVARFPGYMAELARMDGIAAVSAESARLLDEYWSWMGVSRRPEIRVISPGLDAPPLSVPTGARLTELRGEGPELLCVGTLEPRKNHAALIEACEALWSLGLRLRLRLVGLARPGVSDRLLARVETLRSQGRPLCHEGALGEADLEAAYAACDFVVYPSLEEGFGLPVAEALLRGKPCLCSGRGALGEIAGKGGCLTLGQLDCGNLAASLAFLLASPVLQTRLRAECRSRNFPTWGQQAETLRLWLAELSEAKAR